MYWKGFIMRKRFSLLTVSVVVILSLGAGAFLNNVISSDNIYEQISKFKDVLSITEKYYVEDIDTQKLTEAAVVGLLEELDPHSNYIPASSLQRIHEEFQGSFEGCVGHKSLECFRDGTVPRGPGGSGAARP